MSLSQGQSIKLGQLLEAAMVPLLRDGGLMANNSDVYQSLLTRPDFLISLQGNETPCASLAVTATSSRESWIKKRWRYIDEVAQLKSFFGPDFLCVNVFYSDLSALGKNELSINNAFFDASILAFDEKFGKEYFSLAYRLVRNNDEKSVDDIAALLMRDSLWKNHGKVLLQRIQEVLSKRNTLTARNIFKKVWAHRAKGYRSHLNQVLSTRQLGVECYLRYSVINLVLAGKDAAKDIFLSQCRGKAISNEVRHVCQMTKLKLRPEFANWIVDDAQLRMTIRRGLSFDVFSELEGVMITNPSQEYLLDDIRHPERLREMVEAALPSIESKKLIYEDLIGGYQSDKYKGVNHCRVWPLDVFGVVAKESMASLNKLFLQRYGSVGISTPVEGFVAKNQIVASYLKDKKTLVDFCAKLANLIHSLIRTSNVPINADSITAMLLVNKKQALTLQPYLNPLQRYLELQLLKHSFSYKKTSIDCMLGAVPALPSRMSRVEEIYDVRKGDLHLFIKCIAGYDGVKDKTREMAARGVLLGYDSSLNKVNDAKLVFVYDGLWSPDLLRLLNLSGWATLIPILSVGNYLAQIDQGEAPLLGTSAPKKRENPSPDEYPVPDNDVDPDEMPAAAQDAEPYGAGRRK